MLKSNFNKRSQIGRNLKDKEVFRQHMLIKVLKANGKPSRSDCHLCNLNGKRKLTIFKCKTCNKSLCINESESDFCYSKYHKIHHSEDESS